MPFDIKLALRQSSEIWEEEILPTLEDYIAIPAKSPHFDPDWKTTGHIDHAVKLLMEWVTDQGLPTLTIKKLEIPGRTPVIFMEVPGTLPGTVLLYGHLDKQPELEGWREGLSPWVPVREGPRLYGRGGADDGYSTFAAVTAIRLLMIQTDKYPRFVVLIEAAEESGSPDLEEYLKTYSDEIGTPNLVVCLDSGCGDYNRLWLTNSLRGVVNAELTVRILTEGVHSGSSSGIVPDSFTILCSILDRIRNQDGYLKLATLHVDPPRDRAEEIRAAGRLLGPNVYKEFPWIPGGVPRTDLDPQYLLLKKTWEPTMTVIGADGLPALKDAGNVLRPFTTLGLSFRVPPTLDPKIFAELLKATVEGNKPYGADVKFNVIVTASGWNAPPLAPWLKASMDEGSFATFGAPAMAWGEGGTIPFMSTLGKQFPEAQFMITGVLGPGSNAHGANEFLHIPTGMNLTAVVAKVLSDFPKD